MSIYTPGDNPFGKFDEKGEKVTKKAEESQRPTSREQIWQLDRYRVIGLRYHKGNNVYILEYSESDALGAPAWRQLKRFEGPDFAEGVDDFLYSAFKNIHDGGK